MSSITATALGDLVSPGDLTRVHADSVIHSEHHTSGWYVYVDSQSVACFSEHEDHVNEDLAEQLVTALNVRRHQIVKRAELVADIRRLADYLADHPEIPIYGVKANVDTPFFGPEKMRASARTIQAALGDEAATHVDQILGLVVHRRFGDNVSVQATYSRDQVCVPSIVDGKVKWALPELEERTLEAQVARAA